MEIDGKLDFYNLTRFFREIAMNNKNHLNKINFLYKRAAVKQRDSGKSIIARNRDQKIEI